MPELPEVETVRRMLAEHVPGRTIAGVRRSRHALRQERPDPSLSRRLRGRSIRAIGRRGKYLLLDLGGDLTLLSHLGMSGRWLFHPEPPSKAMPHVHARIAFEDGAELWYQDPRRFGMLRLVPAGALDRDPSLGRLGPDPLEHPPAGADLHATARALRLSVKEFLLDQRRIAGIGNIYASEILHRAGVDPRLAARRVPRAAWDRIAAETVLVLTEAVERMGTTFSMYRTLWNEPGQYGSQLRVYDRAGDPCRTCGAAVRRILQGQRSTFFCPRCQARRQG